MPTRAEVHAAVGELVIDSTVLEYLAARVVDKAGMTDNDMGLLRSRDGLFPLAREAARTAVEGVPPEDRPTYREAIGQGS